MRPHLSIIRACTSVNCQLMMIDPATGWFKIVEIPNKQAGKIPNVLEMTWLTRHPWPTETIMDRGREFAAEVFAMIRDECGINEKLITTCNPQANDKVERVLDTIAVHLILNGSK